MDILVKGFCPVFRYAGVYTCSIPVMAMLLRRARLSSWLSCRWSLDLVAAVAAGDRSGLLSFRKSRGGGAANSFWKEMRRKEEQETLDIAHMCWVILLSNNLWSKQHTNSAESDVISAIKVESHDSSFFSPCFLDILYSHQGRKSKVSAGSQEERKNIYTFADPPC